MSSDVVKVKGDKLKACMTCPICDKIFEEATTINLCLHTFCRKCIYDKLSDKDVDTCPVCYINLGSVPLGKLRPDDNVQNIVAKLFPLKGRKVEAPEVATLASPPAKNKEDSMEGGDGSSSSETLTKII